jgi:DNA-binding MarR family transcriptional regulator
MEPSKPVPTAALLVCQDVLALVHSFKIRMAALAEEHGLTGVQLGALYTIAEQQMTIGKVAQALHCDASNATGIVDRLVALGLITRREYERDRRIKLLEITEKGASLVDRVKEAMVERLGCARFSQEEGKLIHSMASKMTIDG